MQPNTIEMLQEYGVQRRAFIRTKNRILLQAMALTRRGLGWQADGEEEGRAALNKRAAALVSNYFAGKSPKAEDAELVGLMSGQLDTFRNGSEPFIKAIAEIEKAMVGLAKILPGIEFVKSVHGFGLKAFAVIISEAGDLSRYPKKGHLWKRLGLAPFEKDGVSKACGTWAREGGLTAEDWVAAGYKRQRLAEVFACLADPMAKGKQLEAAAKSGTSYGKPLGPYGAIYVRRRELTAVRYPEWKRSRARADALRVMSKAVIRDLWRAWRDEVKARGLPAEGSVEFVPTPHPNEQEASELLLPSAARLILPPARPDNDQKDAA